MSFNLTVGQYQLLNEIDEELSMIEQNIYAVAAIRGITYEEASKIKMTEFSKIVSGLTEFNVRLLEKVRITNKINLGGVDYHIEHKPEKLTSGQLLDVLNIRSKNQGKAVEVMDMLLASMCKPKGKEYGDDDLNINERAALIRDVKLSEVWNVFVFFWNLWNNYFNDSEDSLSKWMEETPKKVQQILDEDGDYSA